MSNPSVQLSFTLRTSPNVRTVHLLGSWDTYKNQLPLSVVADGKPGSWKGAFRFQGSHALKLGSRYWYYYIVDGYHVSHDPAKEFTTEPTTGRKLNILDVPGGKGSSTKPAKPAVQTNVAPSNRHSREVPTGRALSPGKILHPKPSKPYASRQLREADYEVSPIEDDDLASRFASTRISDDSHSDRHRRESAYASSPSTLSDSSSSGPGSSDRSSPSSLSSVSDQSCRCERYGVTRSGQRVKLDCGGRRCGYSGSSSECSSEGDEESSESETEEEYRARKRREAREAEKDKHTSTKDSARRHVETDRHGKPVSAGSGRSDRHRR